MIGFKLNRNGSIGLNGRPTPNPSRHGGEACGTNGAYGAYGAHGAYGAYGTYGTYGANGAYEANGAYGAYEAHGTNRALSFVCSLLFIISLICPFSVQAQIKIGGNVYGGGNQGNVNGSTKVTVRAGDIGAVEERADQTTPVANPKGKVFGGARMADVGGNTFVHIDGENATDYIVVNYVYGGNDIAGTIGTAAAVNEDVPTELTEIKKTAADNDNPRKNAVDNTFNSYVRVSAKVSSPAVYYTSEEAAANGKTVYDVKTPAVPAPDAKKIYIGQLFGGGNGAYYYNNSGGTHEIYSSEADFTGNGSPIATSTSDFILPELNKTYLEVVGGSIVYAYGGGNNATVTEKTIIHVDNPTNVVNHILVNSSWLEGNAATYTAYKAYMAHEGPAPAGYTDLLTAARFKEMGINTGFSKPSSDEFQIGRFFGGNNMAEMAIQPIWNLLGGKIRNLYSGGNRGSMTSPTGLLVEVPTYSDIIVDYLYGGCRMADVRPEVEGVYTPCTNLPGYYFPNELSARVLVCGGDIHNVYGGNDVTGRVYGGNAIGIHTSISGDVYGGGNGAYPYTDNSNFIGDDVYGDLYYEGILNDFRPNAEQVSIHLKGTEGAPTVIGGAIYCGGNCATLKSAKENNPLMELKIGSYVRADKAFLGNNGEKMIDPAILERYATDNYNSMNLTDPGTFAEYMEGAAMSLRPSVVFDQQPDDQETYIDYTSQIGSFYCGGNVGSMVIPGKYTLKFDRGLVIFEKLVGGCNNANVEAGTYNAAYKGGILGSAEEQDSYMEGGKIKDRLEINLNNVVIQPKRWDDTFEALTAADLTSDSKLKAGEEYFTTTLRSGQFIADGTEVVDLSSTDKYYKRTEVSTNLVWNTTKWSVDEDDFVATGTTETADDDDRRLYGGNVYGGCYNSGHVNGNVIININQDLHQREVLFAEADPSDPYKIKSGGDRRTGVLVESQGDDVQSVAMSVFGAGYGADTEIWGSTTVNLNNGYAFQIFGGGEEGVVGKTGDEGSKAYNAHYTSTVNLKGAYAGYSEEEEGLPLAETEYIYGGGCEGDVLGDCYVYLGNGRIYDAFGGASNADIYGATEVHIGHNGGFPWIRDNIYGGNDFGGTIKGKRNHTTATAPREAFDAQMLLSSTYVKYIQGRVDSIFGGSYGNYDYKDPVFKDYTYYTGEDGIPEGKSAGDPRLDDERNPVFHFPHLDDNSFVHFIPADNSNNRASFIFGGSEGHPGENKLNNSMQQEAYVLIDDTKTRDANRFANVDIYGGGAFAGMGTETMPGAGRTAIDLYAGSFHNIYGGSNQEGLIGYTRVNVPATSTAKVNAIFGGGKGYDPALFATKPELQARYCDNYVTCVDYLAPNAIVEDAIYGGNHNSRIACDTYINIEAPVMQSSGYQATIYGAGYGDETVSGRTNVFMNNHSNAYKVFGGGRDGNAMNYVSLTRWLYEQFLAGGTPAGEVAGKVTAYGDILRTFGTYLASNPIHLPTAIGTYPNANGEYDGTYTNDILPTLEKPMPTYHQTNVHIMNGGNVSGYAYGGGFGENAVVSGYTYLELLGGNVDKDIYGGGQGGPVFDEYDLKSFTATTNVYIEGGMARNVYGGGYLGHVGRHTGNIQDSNAGDIPAVANVTIGKVDGTSFYNGIPAIQRNAYGGGEGGSVYGTANLTINNGYIGYRYKNLAAEGQTPNYQYVEELDDKTANAIEQAGNAFGGGYVVNSYVDVANVKMYGGTVRGSLYGGGEVGPIGRGTIRYKGTYDTGIVNGDARIYKAGKTHVQLFDGHVKRNVFGGGRGHDSWGGDGTMYMDDDLKPLLDLQCKGYVFGQTEVDVYGGEVGTDEGVALGYGNVFGGGDIGCVYSAYENESGVLSIGKKIGTRYDGLDKSEGYYYKYENGAFKEDASQEYYLTEDCKVVVEPWCKVGTPISIENVYPQYSTVPETEIAYIKDKHLSVESSIDASGKVTAAGGIRYTHAYAKDDFVPTAALNTLGNKSASSTEWTTLGKTDVNKEGVIVHNAVFAGGNTSPGSTEVYANTTTVFGNATASINDVYNRDLISIGRGRIGGLYGDGNLTLVDGYRELNITNYGTDYYHITPEITLAQYNALPNREAAYYEIRYKCKKECTDNAKKTYAVNSTITADEMLAVFEGIVVDGKPMIGADGKPNPDYWVENGVCSRYAGRPMNTVQRADFCGVFGSRMVMQGAQDRVPETVDYTNYTINRVREVSLNKKVSVRSGDSGDDKNKEHGNYFGIYSVVNFLGALTSDVDFHDAVRVTDNSDATTYKCDANEKEYGTATYYDWKLQFHNERKRNNGNSHNKVALASGVYLELTSEKSTGTDLYEKDWGLITGVVELDLINVQPGMGGGYVYARNEHGIRSTTNKDQVILTALNRGAVTNKHFQYTTATDESSKKEWETSGNFVHSTQTIIDDCYNIGGKYGSGYKKPDGVPAHYWFIKGAVYIYDQYISAYTGSPNAYSEIVSIPLTITSASHGKMTLLNVQPNLYAYYSVNSGGTTKTLDETGKIELRETEYGRNDAINFWDWKTLNSHEQKLFVDETYVVTADCVYYPAVGGDPVEYAAGTVLLPSDYAALKAAAAKKDLDATDEDSSTTPYVHHVSKDKDVDFDFVFRPSNNVSHNTGYILTYNIDNPNQWNTWYTPKEGTSLTGKKDSEEIKSPSITPSDYEDGPTYTPNATGLYGQQDYAIGSIISNEEYTTYGTAYGKLDATQKAALGEQAEFYPAYIVTADVLETTNKNSTAQRFHKGATLAEQDYDPTTWTSMSSSVARAYVVTSTIQLSKTEFIYRGTYMKESEKATKKAEYPDLADKIESAIQPAYYCTTAGKYGGNYYEVGHNYRGLAAFSSLSKSDREKFTFNYDALDLLIDPYYSMEADGSEAKYAEGEKYQYDSAAGTKSDAEANPAHYSLPSPIDYTATFKGTSLTLPSAITVKHKNGTSSSETTLAEDDELSREDFESLPNEQFYWAPITVSNTSDTYYVVKETIVLGDTPYAAGQVITKDTYDGLSGDVDNEDTTDDGEKAKVACLTFTSPGTYYYCREGYTINTAHYTGTSMTGAVTDIINDTQYTSTVPAGTVIKATNVESSYGYENIINLQKNFAIHGVAPTETSTLYVTRNSDIFDLSAEKIITVIYKYDYVESDMDGMHITPVSEYHVLNIHLNFKSGVPTVEDIKAPDIILPGTTISIPEPYVTPGAYEITGGGWKLFDTETDAESHINGVEYSPVSDPLYLYQNKHFLAYYAKSYLGETYSNYVPVSVANYHDLKKVMEATDHHYYIDHKEIFNRLKVEPKIYINNYSGEKDGLDLFKDLYDLSLVTGSGDGYTVAGGKITAAESPANTSLVGHNLLNTNTRAERNLEFFLRTDIEHSGSWTSIGDDQYCDDPSTEDVDEGVAGKCFDGVFHGDGHTISGLDHSLFNYLCGEVYNLGVTGSFTGGGIAEHGSGYVESCWIKTTGTTPLDTKPYPIFGDPSRDTGIQLVNSYYSDANKDLYKTGTSARGTAIQMPDDAFYNGEVAYDLNNFYLFKRYNDHVAPGASPVEYKYYLPGLTDPETGKLSPQTGHYASAPSECSSGTNGLTYVEDRFADGDFRYAAGTIPEEEDERLQADPEDPTKQDFYPIYPDDYLFFGQRLNYGYSATYPHNDTPKAIARFNGHLSKNPDANRVYRAPAYYRNSTLDVAHFNPHAYLAAKSKDGLKDAHPNMTAIDFAGHYERKLENGNYRLGSNEEGLFYTPLLDDDGLLSIVNIDETQNLLVYAPASSGDGYVNSATHGVLTSYFADPAYADYYDNDDDYRLVRDASAVTSSIYGHLVQSDLKATNDHLLVDKQEFNAPIAYDFDGSHRMWYQRIPEDQEYVDFTKGWQGISLPFTAELVTTHQKGEITHFYSGSDTSKNGTGTKVGHEYWLREFNGISTGSEPSVAFATFQYPTSAGGDETKDVTNKFLWDYYYQNEDVHDQQDANADTYLEYQQYYNTTRTYSQYPLLSAAKPYIIGFPGETYYEFDLSGNFEAKNTGAPLDELDKQTITFASAAAAHINVSDTETSEKTVTLSLEGASKDFTFAFKPNYLRENLATTDYALNTSGDAYDQVTAVGGGSVTGGATVYPFRPFFTASASAKAAPTKRQLPTRIIFSGANGDEFKEGPESALDGTVEIFARGRNIVTRSHMKVATTIRIVNAAGITLSNFVLPAGQTIETPVHMPGVYIVNKKKVFVR